MAAQLVKDYPWIQAPLVVGAPMRLIALAPLAVEISKAGILTGKLSINGALAYSI